MSDPYTYQKILLKNSVKSYVDHLQEWGNDGWELFDILSSAGFGDGPEVLVRRPAYSPYYPDSWEYHSFNISDMPPEWKDHLCSCGWTIIEPPYFVYYGYSQNFAKRPGWWHGTDDGDIHARLRDLGYYDRLDQKIVREILKLKWELSEKQKNNVGTYHSVRYWLAHIFLPPLLIIYNIPISDNSPEVVLEKLLNLRCALREGEYVPSLEDTILNWSKQLKITFP